MLKGDNQRNKITIPRRPKQQTSKFLVYDNALTHQVLKETVYENSQIVSTAQSFPGNHFFLNFMDFILFE